jgi:RNA polymerase sigma-70 factor (ECF subfamily)
VGSLPHRALVRPFLDGTLRVQVDLGRETIEQAWNIGRAAHPALEVAFEVFVQFAAERAATWAGALDRAADLYVACACVTGVRGAAELFLETFGERIPAYLGELGKRRDMVDEVRQIVLVRCLVPEAGRPPALASYSGRGSLEGWIRATAVREALALERDRARHVPLTTPGARTEAGHGELDREWLVGHYREPVVRSFTLATAALPREHRALLRLHYVHGVTTEQLARMFRVSRATLVRRLAAAREALFERVQGALEGTAGVPAEDCANVLRLVKSQVDLRLSSLLRETAA